MYMYPCVHVQLEFQQSTGHPATQSIAWSTVIILRFLVGNFQLLVTLFCAGIKATELQFP